MTINAFYTNFSTEAAKHLVLKLTDGSSFNQGHTRIEFLSPANELIAHHEIGGQLDFERLHQVQFSVKPIKRKCKGIIKAIIHSTFSKDKLMLCLGIDETAEPEALSWAGSGEE